MDTFLSRQLGDSVRGCHGKAYRESDEASMNSPGHFNELAWPQSCRACRALQGRRTMTRCAVVVLGGLAGEP